MTCPDLTLDFDQFTLTGTRAKAARAFRIVMQPGEVLQIPRTAWTLRVLTGDAWVSHAGLDHTLRAGDSLAIARTRHPAVISAEGRTLFFELV